MDLDSAPRSARVWGWHSHDLGRAPQHHAADVGLQYGRLRIDVRVR